MCDVMKNASKKHLCFMGILSDFSSYLSYLDFYDITHDTFQRFENHKCYGKFPFLIF